MERVSVAKHLGLYFTPSLDPGEHTARIYTKQKELGLIARTSTNALSPSPL